MRKFVKFSIAAGILFLIFFVLLFGLNAFNIVFLICLLYLVLLLLFYHRFGEYSLTLKIAVLVVMILFNLGYLSFFVTAGLNFPKKKNVKNRFKEKISRGNKISGISDLLGEKNISIKHNTNNKLKNFKYRDKNVSGLIDKTENYRKRVLSFLAGETYDDMEYKEDLKNFNINHAKNLEKIYLIQLNRIKKLIDNNRRNTAKKYYIQLWEGLNNYSKQYNNLVELMHYLQISRHMVNLAQNVKLKYLIDNRINVIVNELINNSDSALKNHYLFEFYRWKESYKKEGKIKEELKNINNDIFEDGQFRNIFSSWPLWDKNRFLSLVNLYCYKYYQYSGDKYYNIGSKIKKLEKEKNSWDNFPSFFSNPTGKIIFSKRVPTFSLFFTKVKIKKSMLKAFSWIISGENTKTKENVPVDNLTGEKYYFKRKGKKVTVKSNFEFDRFMKEYELNFQLD